MGSYDATPIASQLFIIGAQMKTLISVLLNNEQKEQYKEEFTNNLNELTRTYIRAFPSVIEDVEQIKKYLEENE